MSNIAIRVERLGKRYRIGVSQAPYRTLRETLVDLASAPARRLRRSLFRGATAPRDNTIWALKDVSFKVEHGEVVGVIGRNGAGKSTLLKILSRITKPTEGRVDLLGRIGSLLEVGTGFHPELTGRENVYLSGAILGMRRAEIEKKFDQIVGFAEVERFLDTAVKHYSSGMYVRLAFAVAAHLEPEILLVDEVLAVGDAAFQQKCLGKMGDVAKHGRTVLFVSHNMSAVRNLCSKTIYLKEGLLAANSDTQSAIDVYLSDVKDTLMAVSLRDRRDRQGSGRAKITDFYVADATRHRREAIESGGDYTFVMEYERADGGEAIANAVGSIAITDSNDQCILLFRSSFTNQPLTLSSNKGRVECKVTDLNLAPGKYNIVVFLSNGETEVLDLVDDAGQIMVEGGDYFGTGSVGLPSHCKVLTRTDWTSS